MKDKKKKNLIYGAIALSLALVLCVGIGIAYFLTNNAHIKFVTSPIDAKFSIGDKNYVGSQEITIPAGNYNIVFKRVLYNNKTLAIKVERGKNITVEATMSLKNLSDKISINYDNLSPSQKKVINLFSQQSTDEQNAAIYDSLSPAEKDIVDLYTKQRYLDEEKVLAAVYPVVSSLPYYTDTYRIDLTYESDSKLPIIDITLLTGGDSTKEANLRQEAETWLTSIDPNYTKLKVRYASE